MPGMHKAATNNETARATATMAAGEAEPDSVVRALTLYDWPQNFDGSAHPAFVVELVEDLKARPTKASFFHRIPNKELSKEYRRTIHKKSKLHDVLSSVPAYESFELCEPIAGNFLNLKSDVQFSFDHKRRYLAAIPPRTFSPADAIRHVRLFCRHLSPRYGFSRIGECAATIFFAGGVSTTDMSREDGWRASALGESRSVTKQHLAGFLLDVFELNVLSPPHLQARLGDKTLEDWIGAGHRGDLIEIDREVAVWLVPEPIRQPIRARLWREGLLIKDTMPNIWKLDLSHIPPA